MDSWRKDATEEYGRDFKWFQKKRPNELMATLNNLHTYWNTLLNLGNPRLIQAGFIHPEADGAIAIDQSGSQKILGKKLKLKETRLYIYPSIESKTLYLLKIGDKASQQTDNQFCKEFIQKQRGV